MVEVLVQYHDDLTSGLKKAHHELLFHISLLQFRVKTINDF